MNCGSLPPMRLVPGADWRAPFKAVQIGNFVGYADWLITLAQVRWSLGQFDAEIDASGAASRDFILLADKEQTRLLRVGTTGIFKMLEASPQGSTQVLYYCRLVMVPHNRHC